MQLTVNGQTRTVVDASTLTDLLTAMNLGPNHTGIAIAVNAEVIARAMWATTRLHNGDHVDIIQAVQGG